MTHNNFLKKFVLSYSIVIILFLVMGFIFYYTGISSTKNDLYKRNASLLSDNVDSMDTALSLFSTLSQQISSNSEIKELTRQTEPSPALYLLAHNAMQYLKDILALENLLPISKSYIYLPNTDKFLSSYMFNDPRLYYDYTLHYDTRLYDDWYETMSSYDDMFKFISLAPYGATDGSYLYKVELFTFRNDPKPPIACFIVDQAELLEHFSDIDLANGACLYITDELGNSIMTLAKNSQALSYDASAVVNSENQKILLDNVRQANTNAGKFIISHKNSSYNNWNYYLITPTDNMLHELVAYQYVYLLTILFSVLSSFGLIYGLSKRNVAPIISMSNSLETSLSENRDLRETLDKQQPYVYSSCISKLFKGAVAEGAELNMITNFLGVNPADYRFCVLYLKTFIGEPSFISGSSMPPEFSPDLIGDKDTTASQHLMSSVSQDSYRELIVNSLYEYFGNNIYVYNEDINTFSVMLLVSLDEELDSFTRHMRHKFVLLHDFLQEEHSIWIYGGLGKRNHRLNYVWQSYHQAMEAASYINKNSFFICNWEIERTSNSYYYPAELANQLSSFIRSSNDKQVAEIFKIIRRENYELRSLPANILSWLLSDIRNTLVKIRYSITASETNEPALANIDSLLLMHKTVDIMEQIALTLSNLFEQKPVSNQLIATIKQYLNNNYNDSSLSLKKISDEFSISESYFSFLFKAETNENFSEYLEKLRMDRALDLIKNTDTALSEIYVEVGYNNPTSFRRAFKKVHGATPTAIRGAANEE
ncbi:MAG: helix-turn-helix transcriptional regulator [Lachnospiraceae bacterium]|nr:helix-turn-helix transcriptional regulator [Lachnospiraceae bacterium]